MSRFINSIHNLSSSHSISATFHSSISTVIHFTITFSPTEDDNGHPKSAKAGRGKTNCTSPGGQKPQTEHCAAQSSTAQHSTSQYKYMWHAPEPSRCLSLSLGLGLALGLWYSWVPHFKVSKSRQSRIMKCKMSLICQRSAAAATATANCDWQQKKVASAWWACTRKSVRKV